MLFSSCTPVVWILTVLLMPLCWKLVLRVAQLGAGGTGRKGSKQWILRSLEVWPGGKTYPVPGCKVSGLLLTIATWYPHQRSKSNESPVSGTGIFKTMNPNSPFLSISRLSWVFCYSDEKLTNPRAPEPALQVPGRMTAVDT